MDLHHVVKESELYRHVGKFGFPLECVKTSWKQALLTSFTNDPEILKSRAQKVQTLAKYPDLVNQTYDDLKTLQKDEALLLAYKPSDTSKTAEEQIFFTGDHTKPLNFVPYLLAFLVFFKVWLAPALALMTPLILFFLPYVIMHTVLDMKIPWEMYIPMMKQMMFGITPGSTATWSAKQYAQVGWTCLSLGQGIVMPFFTAYHTYKLDTTIVERGQAIQRLATVARTIVERYNSANKSILSLVHLQVPDVPTDPREAVAWIDQEKLALPTLFSVLGQLGLYTSLARDRKWQSFQPVAGEMQNTALQFTDIYDLAIPAEKAVRSDLTLQGNSLLTGPNRGGKSSSLRATLQQVLLGQTFGLTYDCHGSWKPFKLIFTRLKSKDHAGKESLFEMEVRMAASMLKTTEASRAHTLLLIDELFHSTNPPDAETSAKIFLERLWKLKTTKSIISTHIFSLCEAPGHEGIQTLCVPAEERDQIIQYSYELQPGICRTSSVREVLRESGLLR